MQQLLIFKKYAELDIDLLYKILQLRSEVFVVEQQCFYQDLDNKDLTSIHACLFHDSILVGYCRILPKHLSYDQCSIGRVVVKKNYRNRGLAKQLMEKAITFIRNEWNEQQIRISAQLYLQHFYESLGFNTVGKQYDEDGLPHIEMIKH